MAQNNRREIELALSVTTTNADALGKLQQDVQKLAKEGGEAAPAFQKLADELGQLAAQAKQLTALEGLTTNLQAASAAQAEAATKSNALKQNLAALVLVTDQAREAERAKNLELSNAKRAVQESQDAIAKLKNDTSEAGKSTATYTIKLVELKTALLDARAQKRDLAAQLDTLKAKTTEASAAVTAQGRAYKDAARDTDAATRATRDLQTSVDAVKEKYRAAGGAAADLAAAQRDLAAASAQTRAATQAVITDQERLARAERDAANESLRLGAIMAETRRRQAAQARAEADGIIADFQRMERAQREAAQVAKASADAMANAFRTVGVRSAQEIRQEIERVREAMQRLGTNSTLTGGELANAMRRGEAAVNGLQRELREVTGTLTTADKAAALLKNSMGQIAAGNLVADGIGYLVEKVKDLGREFVGAVVQSEQMRRGLTAIYKDAGVAASQISFLRSAANAAGVSFGGLSKDFVRFSAAMSSAGVPMAESNALFASLTRAAGTLGLRAEETAGTLNALGQMASKGTVSMEELRQQLGDRLPGAFGLVAKGLGITEAALVQLVSTGGLAARDLFPALTQALKTLHGEAAGITPAFERFKGALTEVAQGMGDAGAASALTQAIKLLGGAVLALSMGLSTLWEGLYLSGKALEAWWKQIRGNKGAWDAFGAEVDKSAARLAGQGRAFQALNATQDVFTEGQKAAMVAMSATTAAAVTASEGLGAVGRAAELQALATKLAADSTLDASSKLVQFNVAAGAMLATQQKMTEAAAKVAKAVKDEGDALVLLAKLRGDEQLSLVASATAAENYAAELLKVAASQQAEVDILKLQLVQLDESAKARGLSALAIKTQREELEKKIALADAEAAQAKAAVEAARQEAVARQIAAEAYADNSARVAEYREAMIAAARAVAALEEHHRRGTFTAAELKAGQDELTKAIARYNDALGDAVKLQQAYADAQKSVHALELSGLDLALKQAQAAERMAKLDNDAAGARAATIKQREIEIQIVQLKVKALETEAQGMIAVARASEAELTAKNALTPVERARIDNALRAADAKMLEAKATGASIEVLQKELGALSSVNAALKTLGVDAGVVSTKLSAGFKESFAALDTLTKGFDTLSNTGVKATDAITLGLNKLMGEAKNQADLDALTEKIKSLRGVLGDKVTDGFLEQAKEAGKKLKETMDAATPGINSVAEALKTLGIKSEEELDGIAAKAKEAFEVVRASGTASPREISEAWKAMAEASIAANGGVADAAITSGAAAQGFAIEVDAAGKASVKSLGEVEKGFEKIDRAAQMAGKSVEELQAIKAEGWNIAEDMKEAADIQNAATNALTNAWRSAIVEADAYYTTLYKIYNKLDEFKFMGPAALEKEIWRASAALKELDEQQQAIERSSDDAASGLASLEDKLLALSGSEEEVAARRKARDQAEIQKKMALLELDLQRAQIRKNDEEVAQLTAELKLYSQQLVLLDQIAQKEKNIRDEAKRKQEEEDKARKAKAAQDAKDANAKAAKDKAEQAKAAQVNNPAGSGGSAAITAAPPAAPGAAYVNNITIGGMTRQITTDKAGASALQDVLRDLGAASSRTST